MKSLNIYGKIDTLNENLIIGADLVGKYGFPQLRPVDLVPQEIIAFSDALRERKPRGKCVHFFIDDDKFERVWNAPDRYFQILQYFDGVVTPDFSSYLDMPMACQIWNRYRNRVMAYYYQSRGLNIIPTVGWSDTESYDWCFDGLPQHSTLAVSTNGCFSEHQKQFYINGMIEMEQRLMPNRIICIGRKIDVPINTQIIYYDSFGQTMTKRLRGDMSYGR